MREQTDFCFKGEEKQLIAAVKFGATWTDNKNKFKKTFDKASSKLAISFVLYNFIFSFGYLSI